MGSIWNILSDSWGAPPQASLSLCCTEIGFIDTALSVLWSNPHSPSALMHNGPLIANSVIVSPQFLSKPSSGACPFLLSSLSPSLLSPGNSQIVFPKLCFGILGEILIVISLKTESWAWGDEVPWPNRFRKGNFICPCPSWPAVPEMNKFLSMI